MKKLALGTTLLMAVNSFAVDYTAVNTQIATDAGDAETALQTNIVLVGGIMIGVSALIMVIRKVRAMFGR
jgi:hypothetical protein